MNDGRGLLRYIVRVNARTARAIAIGFACACVVFTAGFVLGVHAVPRDRREYAKFQRVARLIEQHYVDPVDPADLEEAATRGLFDALDAHSEYMDADEYGWFESISIEGRYAGLGIRIESDAESGYIRVVAPLEASPALRAGIRAGDLIVAVDGESTHRRKVEEVARQIRGPEGTTVALTILRGDDPPVEMELTRAIIRLPATATRTLEDGVAYLRIREFTDTAPDEVAAALDTFAAGGATALVLDLRENPGGLLEAAAKIADYFLDEVPIVEVRSRSRPARTIRAKQGVHPAVVGARIAVLVNERTASAAEILAGALQDHGRARVFGKRTYGKGTVQDLMDLGDGSVAKITTARYYMPSGRCVDRGAEEETWGIEPDVVVETDADTEAQILEAWSAERTPETDPVLQAALDWIRSP
jgi:carboxyl-terminal processing protease